MHASVHQSLRATATRRSHTLLASALLAAAVLLAGCGFQLRGPAQLPFSTVYLTVGNTEFGQELRRALRLSNARLVDSAKEAQASLVIQQELREKRILSLGAQGRVREYQLRYVVAYRLNDPTGRTLIAPSEILLTRDISFNDAEILAKEAEELLLYRDMQNDAVQQLMRRLQATKLAS